jgi:glycosyltransferase involved in cell wall biosynthesis
MRPFAGRLGLQQRVLPGYRAAFFDHLASRCDGGLGVFAGEPRANEAITTTHSLSSAKFKPARNIHLLGGKFYLCFQSGIQAWLSEWDPSALILEANARYPLSRGAMTWMRRKGRPVLGWGLGAPGRSSFRDGFLKSFDALIAYSNQGAEEYESIGFAAERIFVAPNAVTGPPLPLPVREADGSDRMTILFVGRLQERKRVDLLLRACGRLDPKPALWIVGDGPARTALEREALSSYPSAEFMGALQGEALEAMFRLADLFVLPGTGGLAVQQAMAHGLPVIVAEADGSQRDLVKEHNGWMVPPGDLEALALALEEALRDPVRLREMGAASHRIVSERVNIEIMAEVFLTALQAVRTT